MNKKHLCRLKKYNGKMCIFAHFMIKVHFVLLLIINMSRILNLLSIILAFIPSGPCGLFALLYKETCTFSDRTIYIHICIYTKNAEKSKFFTFLLSKFHHILIF